MSVSLKKLDAQFDFVAVIDCLPQTQRVGYKISSELSGIFQRNGYGIEVFNCNNRSDFYSAFDQLRIISETGENFMIHFVSHGNSDGLYIEASDEFIIWDELRDLIFPINSQVRESLVLNMTSCFGLNVIKANDPSNVDRPFFGIIGCHRDLVIREALVINTLFYESLMSGCEIGYIIGEIQDYFLKNGCSDEVIYCISSEGFSLISNNKSKYLK
ncbi:MAG TPA: hypothetical protein DIW47_12885 [Bacteroidetes bacterium]|nr:hypothetical protein [Bacteroidota bacterium]